MINGAGVMNDTCLAEDSMSDISVQNGKVGGLVSLVILYSTFYCLPSFFNIDFF